MTTARNKAIIQMLPWNPALSFYDLLEEGIFRVNPSGIQFANLAFMKMFAFHSIDEIKEVQFNDLLCEEHEAPLISDKLHATGQLVNYKILFKRSDSKSFYGLLTLRKTFSDSDDYVLEGCIKDISTQLQTEEQLKQRELSLEKLSMELDRFIYSASHDIRSPVSTILGIINLMKLDFKNKETRTYVGMMEQSMGKLDQFIKMLVAYAKNSKMVLADNNIDFTKTVSGVLNELRLMHSDFSKVSVSSDIEVNHCFYSDEERLHLILYNIIKNAFDYQDHHKAHHLLSITIRTTPETAFIDIFDNGIGISSSHISHVFEMFYRATQQSKGSGIGLYTVREAVIKLNGTIALDSEYGVGTSIQVEIPNSKKGKLINKKNMLKVHK